jgi:hypothetical protein
MAPSVEKSAVPIALTGLLTNVLEVMLTLPLLTNKDAVPFDDMKHPTKETESPDAKRAP